MSTLKEILKTKCIKHFDFTEIFNLRNNSVSVALDLKNYNIIVFNLLDENVITIYGCETPIVVEALLSVNHGSENYQSVINGDYELDLEVPEDKKDYQKLLKKYSERLSRTTNTYTVLVRDIENLDVITLKDDEDLDEINISDSDVNELCALMLKCYQERVVKIENR